MSSLKLIHAYWQERYPASIFVPFAVVIAAAGTAAGGSLPTVRDAVTGCILAYTLVLVFRIADDLADLRSDRMRHPGRVLVRASSVTPIIVIAFVIAVGDVVMMLTQPRPVGRLAVFAAISLFVGLWYLVRAHLRAGPLTNAHVLLIKYPVISLLTCASWDGVTLHTALPSFGTIYLGLCIYEQLHDHAVRESPGGTWIFAAEVCLLLGLPLMTGGLIWSSLCNLSVLGVSVVVGNARYNNHRDTEDTEVAQRTSSDQSGPPSTHFEKVSCYYCQATEWTTFITAQDDLTGRPGTFTFTTCTRCGLRYQNPRLGIEHVKDFYDHEYIAHRKKTDWGLLTGCFNWVMDRHDRQKDKLVRRYVKLDAASEVLDVGCAVGTFLQRLRARYGARVAGVDFKDLRGCQSLEGVEFHCGLFYEQPLESGRFDAITMWHFLEHDYDPLRTLQTARDLLRPSGCLVIEVPRLDSLTFRLYGNRWPGLQAPQHTVLYDREMLLRMVQKAGLEVVDYLPYGAFPAFFYFFAGAAFKLLKGKGLNLSKAIYPYFAGQILFAPILAFEKYLNFAMQTVVCKRKGSDLI